MSVFQDVVGENATGTGNTAAVQYDRFAVEAGVQVFGTFVGTYDVELSIDGTNFSKFATGKTGPEFLALPAARKCRLAVTAYTSGTIEWRVGGVAHPN